MQYKVGDVFQINEKNERQGLIGSYIMPTEIKSWGIQGFVAHVETFDEQKRIFLRLKWDQIDYVGPAVLKPAD